jgi:tetratricopeptide (TPR) repeat protein
MTEPENPLGPSHLMKTRPIERLPRDPAARGHALFEARKLGAAIHAYREALEGGTRSALIYERLGWALKESGELMPAVEALLQGIGHFRTHAPLYALLGLVFWDLGRPSEAVHVCETATILAPDNPEVLDKRLTVLLLDRQVEKALEIADEALRRNPDNLPAMYARGIALHEQLDFEQATRILTEISQKFPHFRNVYSALGSCAMRQGDFDTGERLYRKAHQQNPGSAAVSFGLGLTLLGKGDFSRGWILHEDRIRVPALASKYSKFNRLLECFSRWDGRALKAPRELVIFSEQGLGDYIQFARYLPQAAARADVKVSASLPTPLLRLMRGQTDPRWQQIDWIGEETRHFESASIDLIMSLPHRLAVPMRSDQPAQAPYLHAPAEARAEQLGRVAPSTRERPIRAGIVWAGNPGHTNDRLRSLPFEQLAPLFATPGVQWYSLQKGGAEAALAECPWSQPVIELGRSMRDLADTAAIVEQLDLVISIDSAPAHLAGALGTKCWTLIAKAPDWRWLRSGSQTHWYAGMQLWRQDTDGRWEPVIERVARALALEVQRKRGEIDGTPLQVNPACEESAHAA